MDGSDFLFALSLHPNAIQLLGIAEHNTATRTPTLTAESYIRGVSMCGRVYIGEIHLDLSQLKPTPNKT